MLFAGALTLLLIAGAFAGPTFAHRDKPRGASHHPGAHRVLIIGHRGSAGYRPEHTLAAYELGARMGADYVEPDLVTTKDHVLVARHEPNITDTTDVADHPEFASRKTTKTIDGVARRAGSRTTSPSRSSRRCAPRSACPRCASATRSTTAATQVPTFQEVIDLRKRLSRELHRDIGIYPETKHPTYFRADRAAARGAARPDAQPQRPQPAAARRSSCSPSRSPNLKALRPGPARAARPAARRRPSSRTTCSPPVTRRPTATWRRPRA